MSRVGPAPTVGAALAETRRALAGLDAPGREAGVLVAHALGLPRTALLAHPERPLLPGERERVRAAAARRAAGEPFARIAGRREFRSLDFEVDRSTLVPRPETERLVEAVLDALAAPGVAGAPRRPRVADLGTGCGAVAVAVARAAPRARVVATDLDPRALAVARRNVRRLAPGRVELRRGDWCGPLEPGVWTVVASNPPYVRAGDPHLRGDGVRREPRRALVGGGPDGLGALRAIARGALSRLRPGGRVLLEHGADQGRAVRALLRAGGYRRVRTHRDLAGRERVTEGERPRRRGRGRTWAG